MDFLGRARTFVRIVEGGSLSAAARSLRLSLPAISRQVATLEAEVGATLIARTTRRLNLTEEGRRFHAHATRLVAEADAAHASVRQAGALAGTVTLGASVAMGVLRVVPALPKLIGAHPSLVVDLRLDDRVSDLVGEGIDVVIRAGMAIPDTTTLVAQPVATFARLLVASPAYVRRAGRPKTVAALASHPTVSSGTGATWSFVENGAAVSVSARAKVRVETLLARRAAVLAGLGIAVLPDFVVAEDLANGSLERLLPRATLEPVAAHALYRVEARGTPRVEALVKHLRATLSLSTAATRA